MSDDWGGLVSFDKKSDAPSDEWAGLVRFNDERPKAAKATLTTPKVPEVGALESGYENLKADVKTGGARILGSLGMPEWSKATLESAEANRAVAAGFQPKVSDYTKIEGLGDAATWAKEGALQSAPGMAPVIAGAYAGGAMGSSLGPLGAGAGALLGGAAASIPQFFGSNIKRQVEEGKAFDETSILKAGTAALAQAGAEGVLSRYLPFLGAAAKGGTLTRFAKKGAEAGVVGGTVEGFQQALEVLQANPDKIWEMPPEIRTEIINAALLGGLIEGAIGGAGGALNGRRPEPSSPVAEEPGRPIPDGVDPTQPLGPFPNTPPRDYNPTFSDWWTERHAAGPNPTFSPNWQAPGSPNPTFSPNWRDDKNPPPYDPNGSGLPQERQPPPDFQPDPSVFGLGPEAREAPWYPDGRGFPGQEVPKPRQFNPDGSVMGLGPETDLPWRPDGSGLPRPPGLPPSRPHFVPDASVRGLGPETPPGQKIFRNIQQQLLAARQKQLDAGQKAFADPIQINAMARAWRERYETLAKQKGTDAYEEFARENLTIKQVANTPVVEVKKASLGNVGNAPKAATPKVATPKAGSHLEVYNRELARLKAAGVPADKARDQANAAADAVLKGKTLKQEVILDPETRTANFKRWSRGAPVVEHADGYRGGPGVFKVFHGTTHTDINEIDPKKGDMVGSLGRGFYTTTNPDDASANYANRNGPDAEYRIKRMADHIAERDGLDWDEAMEEAKKEVLGPSEGAVMPVYVRMNNPLDTRKSGTTFSGRSYVRMIKAINDLAASHPDPEIDIAPAVAVLNNQYEATGQVSARDAYDIMKKFGDVNPDVGAGGYGQFFQNVAKRLGYDGLIEPAGQRFPTMEGMTKDTLHIVPFDGAQVKGQFNRGTYEETSKLMEQQTKGEIEILPNSALIRLFNAADASTFMHESMHLWLEGMVRNAPHNRQIAHDVQALRDWTGNDGGPFTTAQHEQVARGFEQYLRTGKAPNRALADLFKQFAEWLVKIYRQATDIKTPDGKSVTVPDHISGVYERLFAIDEKLAEQVRSSPVGDGNPLPISGNSRTFQQTSSPQGDNPVKKVTNRASQWLKDISDPLSRVDGKNDYLKVRNPTSGRIYAGQQEAKAALDLYSKVSLADQKKITEYFTTPNAPIDMVPKPLQVQTAALKKRLYDFGQELVKRKVLSQDTFDANAGQYLPRVYLKHLMDHNGITGVGVRANLNEVKKRKNLSLEARTALGEIHHPGVLTNIAIGRMSRDIAALDFLDQIYQNESWARPKSTTNWDGHRVTPEWLLSEADEIIKSRAPAMEKNDKPSADAMRAVAGRMREAAFAAQRDLKDDNFDPKEWKQLPNVPQYGALRGAWVKSQIVDDIVGMSDYTDMQSWAGRHLGDRNSTVVKLVQMWKAAKVPWNVASHFRNFGGNMIQSHIFGGIPLYKVPAYLARAAKEMRNDGPVWKMAKEQGIPLGTMAEAEFHALADTVLRGLEGSSTDGKSGILKTMTMLGKINAAVMNTYQGSESLFKTAVMAHAMDKGMSGADAAVHANDSIYDYSLVHPSIKYLRNSPLGMPFITWTYKTLPKLAQTLTNRETATRFLPYVALGFTIPAIVAASNDLEEGDEERLRKALSEALRRQNNMYLLPYKDANGNWQFVDVGYFLPWQMPQDVVTSLAKGQAGEAYKSLGLFSSPIVGAITAMNTGIDPFTQRPIADKRDPLNKQVMDVAAYLWGMAMPTTLTQYGALGKAIDKVDGTGLNRYGEPGPDWTQVGARLFGVNIYPVNPDAQRARNLLKMEMEINQIKSRMTYSLKDKSLTPEQKRDVMQDFREKIIERNKEMAKYAKESAMTPSLRAATARP